MEIFLVLMDGVLDDSKALVLMQYAILVDAPR